MKYSITDVSKITKISSSAIRFYEEKVYYFLSIENQVVFAISLKEM